MNFNCNEHAIYTDAAAAAGAAGSPAASREIPNSTVKTIGKPGAGAESAAPAVASV